MFIVSGGYNPKSHGLREEHLFPSQGKRQFTEPNSEVVPLLGVSEEDFRAAMITVPVKIKENTFTMYEKIGNLSRQIENIKHT